MSKMAHNIIEGINTVIKGLEMIKVELVSKVAQEDLAVKVAEIIKSGATTVVAQEAPATVAVSPKVEKVELVKEEKPEVVEEAPTVVVDRRAELEALSYNEIKSIVSSLGGKAVGKKDKLIDLILELEGDAVNGEDAQDEDVQETQSGDEEADTRGGESDAEESEEETADDSESGDEELVEEDAEEEEEEEEESEDEESEEDEVGEFRDFLNALALDEVEEIADELGIKFGVELKKKDRAKVTEQCLADLNKLAEVLEELGYYEEDEEVEEAEEEVEEEAEELTNDIAEELGLYEMEIDELADILNEYDLSTKGKKQALIDRIVKAVEDGIIEVDDEEEEEEEPVAKGGKKSKK